jgi:hypothetical protein
VFRKTAPVERRRIEQVDAKREGPLDRGDRNVVAKSYKEVAQRRRSESEYGNFEPRSAEDSTGQCGRSNHMSLFQPHG